MPRRHWIPLAFFGAGVVTIIVTVILKYTIFPFIPGLPESSADVLLMIGTVVTIVGFRVVLSSGALDNIHVPTWIGFVVIFGIASIIPISMLVAWLNGALE